MAAATWLKGLKGGNATSSIVGSGSVSGFHVAWATSSMIGQATCCGLSGLARPSQIPSGANAAPGARGNSRAAWCSPTAVRPDARDPPQPRRRNRHRGQAPVGRSRRRRRVRRGAGRTSPAPPRRSGLRRGHAPRRAGSTERPVRRTSRPLASGSKTSRSENYAGEGLRSDEQSPRDSANNGVRGNGRG